ncbi:alpha/beta hydrolase [Deinococcus aetherius]|nr:alpha/beta hydrolase [Deinococcus aetherius]
MTRLLLTGLLLLLLGFLAATAGRFVVRPPLVVGQDAAYPGARAMARLEREPQPFIDIAPVGTEADTLLILYPGGLVRPQAYEWIGRALAGRGVRTVIPVFPLDLAVLSVNRADALIGRFGAGKRVFLAGHSLGGAMAAGYAARHGDQLSGLILMGAYPPNNVSLRDSRLRVLSLLAERDGVASPGEVRGGLERLPPGTQLTVLPGAVHAFFGRYGPQRGDGLPTVERATTEAQIVQAVGDFLTQP